MTVSEQVAANSAIIDALNPVAAALADAFLGQYPLAALTSGLRTLEDQAHDDAVNIVQANDPQWMSKVYVASAPLASIQGWIDQQTWPIPLGALEFGILGVLRGLAPADLRHLSWHLSGDAFDVQPCSDQTMVDCLTALVSDRVTAGGAGKMLQREGGLVRWHVQVA